MSGQATAAPATRDWESVFGTWAKGPSSTEDEMCRRAADGIQKAINESPALREREVTAFVQGSYKNRVNISQGSDIDVGVACRQTLFSEIPQGTTLGDFGLIASDYSFKQFKKEVLVALQERFRGGQITLGDKSIKLRGNTYRIEADVVPFFEYREYDRSGAWNQGVKLIAESGGTVINWPQQHYDNGLYKHEKLTMRRHRKVVRIVKRLAKEMAGSGSRNAQGMPSFLLECAVYNVPHDAFGAETLKEDVRLAILHIATKTSQESLCSGWTEVSGLKPLFASWQPWRSAQLHDFAIEAWRYVGFE